MKDPLIQQALDALETCQKGGYIDIDGDWCGRQVYDAVQVDRAVAAARARLAEPDPEPVRWLYKADSGEHVETQQLDYTYRLGDGYAKGIPLYTAPPTTEAAYAAGQRDERDEVLALCESYDPVGAVQRIRARSNSNG